jgi:hypothetical protein
MDHDTFNAIKILVLLIAFVYWIVKKINWSSIDNIRIPEMNKPKEDTSKEDISNDETSGNVYDSFHDETEEAYVERCLQAVRSISKSFILTVKERVSSEQPDVMEDRTLEEYLNSVQVLPLMKQEMYKLRKVIIFRINILQEIIPDDKLAVVAELVNRLNQQILLNVLALDYENRSLSYKTTLFVGNGQVDGVEVIRHLSLMLDAVDFIPYFYRVIFQDEEPALVALDFHYG